MKQDEGTVYEAWVVQADPPRTSKYGSRMQSFTFHPNLTQWCEWGSGSFYFDPEQVALLAPFAPIREVIGRRDRQTREHEPEHIFLEKSEQHAEDLISADDLAFYHTLLRECKVVRDFLKKGTHGALWAMDRREYVAHDGRLLHVEEYTQAW